MFKNKNCDKNKKRKENVFLHLWIRGTSECDYTLLKWLRRLAAPPPSPTSPKNSLAFAITSQQIGYWELWLRRPCSGISAQCVYICIFIHTKCSSKKNKTNQKKW